MDSDTNTSMATCATMIRPNDEQEVTEPKYSSRLTFRSKFEHILGQLSLFVGDYQRELQHLRGGDEKAAGAEKSKTDKSMMVEDKPAVEPEEDVAKSLADVNETLVNIEEDLHKIVSLMMLHVELMLQQRRTPRSLNRIGNDNHNNSNNNNAEDSLIEFHDYCHEEELKFNRQLAKLKVEMDKNKAKVATTTTPRRHYQLKSSDVHFILGTNPGTSHSIVAAKQMKLAELKQHTSLCEQSSILATEPTTTAITFTSGGNGPKPSEISKQIQTMIEQLQMEHDLIYRLLQKQVKKTDPRSQLRTRMLMGHMVHIMNHIHDLHQVNNRFLLDH